MTATASEFLSVLVGFVPRFGYRGQHRISNAEWRRRQAELPPTIPGSAVVYPAATAEPAFPNTVRVSPWQVPYDLWRAGWLPAHSVQVDLAGTARPNTEAAS